MTVEQGAPNSQIPATEIKPLLLDIMSSIDSFCTSHDIKYSLAFGSLIGAIRHKGFIPWDDDIDIFMTRDDYQRFINDYNHAYYAVHCQEKDPEWFLNFAKVYDERTYSFDQFGNKTAIAVDIFILDGAGNTIGEANKQRARIQRLEKIWSNQLFTRRLPISKKYGLRKNLLIITGKISHQFISLEWIVNKIIREREKKNIADCKYCTPFNDTFTLLESEKISRYIKVPFEDRLYLIYAEYDYQLTADYGNYMELPPIEQRINHGLSAFWK